MNKKIPVNGLLQLCMRLFCLPYYQLPIIAVIVLSFSTEIYSGGFIADSLKPFVGKKIASDLDDAHKQVKQNIPYYGEVEEFGSDVVRRVVKEASVETAGPVLAQLINASRNDARNAGVRPIPTHLYHELKVYFKESMLRNVRYRVGQGNELSLQANSFRFGDKSAIALVDTIVFRTSKDAESVYLWAHELGHIMQYRDWGTLNFAKRYIRNSNDVEDGAELYKNQFSDMWGELSYENLNFSIIQRYVMDTAEQVSQRYPNVQLDMVLPENQRDIAYYYTLKDASIDSFDSDTAKRKLVAAAPAAFERFLGDMVRRIPDPASLGDFVYYYYDKDGNFLIRYKYEHPW